MASLNSVQLKIFRAAQHIESLKSELEKYFETNPGRMVGQANASKNEVVFQFVPTGPIPARFGLIVGDVLQNLRSSLDYLVWELVLAANGQPSKDNMFPICSTNDSFKQQISRHRLEGASPEAIAEIERLQPYHLGQDFNKSILWVLDELTNINKHRRILLTNLMAAPIQKEEVVVQEGQMWVRMGPGPVRVLDSNTQFTFPLIDGKVHVNTHITASVAFDEGPASGMEVSFCAGYWSYYISQTLLPRFEKFFPLTKG